MAKLSISKAWDEARVVIGRDGSPLATIALALLVLPGLIADLFMPHGDPRAMLSGAGGVLFILVTLIGLVGQLAIVRIASGAGGTVGDAIGHAAKRIPAYLGATLMWAFPIALLVAFIAFNSDVDNPPSGGVAALILAAALTVIVAIFVLVPRMILCAAVASNEPIGPVDIVRRSWNLTSRHWARLLGFMVLFVILLLVLMAAMGAVVGSMARLAFGELEPWSIGGLVVSLLSQLIGAALSVVFSVMVARIYLQLAGPDHASTSVPSSRD